MTSLAVTTQRFPWAAGLLKRWRSVMTIVVVLSAWALLTETEWIKPTVLASPSAVVDAFRRLFVEGFAGSSMWGHIGASVQRWLLGVAVAAIVAVAVTAAIFAFSRGTREVTESALSLHQADDTLRVATVARYQLGFAVHLALLDSEFGSDFSDVRAEALAEGFSGIMARALCMNSDRSLSQKSPPSTQRLTTSITSPTIA